MAQHGQSLRTPLTETERAYLAGILDGEGSISIIRRPPYAKHGRESYFVQVAVGNTERPLLEWLAATFGGGICTQTKGRKKRYYFWQRKHGSAGEVLRAALPYLRIKGAQAKLALRVIEESPSENPGRRGHPDEVWETRRAAAEEMRRLNRSGRGFYPWPNTARACGLI